MGVYDIGVCGSSGSAGARGVDGVGGEDEGEVEYEGLCLRWCNIVMVKIYVAV